MLSESISIGHVVHNQSGENKVSIRFYCDKNVMAESVMEPAIARDVAADLLHFADSCDAAETKAEQVAQSLLAKLSNQDAWVRDNESVFLSLLLVNLSDDLTDEVVASWSDEDCRSAQDWAIAAHLKASDNDVTVPPLPEVLEPYRPYRKGEL